MVLYTFLISADESPWGTSGVWGGLNFLMSSIMCCHYVIFQAPLPGENKHAMLSLRQLDWKASHKSQKTHTLSRGTPEYCCWQRICPVTVVTRKWPEAHVKVGDDLFPTNATSLWHFAQSWNVKCHQRGFGYQVHKSHRVPALEPESITRKVHKEVQPDSRVLWGIFIELTYWPQ